MINPQNFVQYDIPILYRIMTIKQPADDISIQFWDHVVELYTTTEIKNKQELNVMNESSSSRTNRSERQRQKVLTNTIQLLFAKGKEGMLNIWRFQNSCLINQKSIKISYYLTKQITMIKAFTIHQKLKRGQQQSSSIKSHSCYSTINAYNTSIKFDILMLGYIDGTLQIFELQILQPSVQLTKCLQIKNSNSQPVTNCEIYDNSQLFVCRTHAIYMYQKLIEDLIYKLVTKSKEKLNSSEKYLRVSELENSTKLNITVSSCTHNLHIYNQLQGMFTFSLPEMHSQNSIIDSIKHLIQTPQGDLIIASSDDCVKIIYSQSNEIQKIIGLKSFITTIHINQLQKQKLIELWMADCYGQLHYFVKENNIIGTGSSNREHVKNIKGNESKHLQKQEKQQQNHHYESQLVMFQTELNKSLKITENGIKKIIVSNNILLIVDTQMNILLYDVVRNVKIHSGRSEN